MSNKIGVWPILTILLASMIFISLQSPAVFAQGYYDDEACPDCPDPASEMKREQAAQLDPVITEFRTDKNSYKEGNTIVISGHIENHFPNEPARMHVDVAKGGSLLPFDAPVDANGNFETEIIAGGPEWSKEGTYRLGVYHVGITADTTFEYTPPPLAPINITQDTFIKTDRKSYTYTQDLDIVISGNIGNLQLPITIEVQCDIIATSSVYIPFREFGTASHQVKPDGSFEYRLGTLGFGCNYQTSTATVRIQGTDISTSFQMIGEEAQSDPEIPPTSSIISFDIDITNPSHQKFPIGRLYGQTEQGNTGLFIVLRDPDGLKVWNHPRISDSNGYFDYRFNIGDPTVLVKEGTFTAIAHLYTETEVEGLRVKFDNVFQQESVPQPNPVPEPIPVGPPITVYTDRSSYSSGDVIGIYGQVRDLLPGTPVSLQLFAANGNLVTIEQMDVGADYKFRIEITDNILWSSSGTYTIKVLYGTYARTAETTFEFNSDYEEQDSPYEPEPEKKILICHTPSGNPSNGHTISIPQSAWSAHQAHGDTGGECLQGTIPEVFGDIYQVIISQGTSVPGCDETNECFIPAEVTVNVGETVTWSNDDSAAHTVTSGTPIGGPDGTFDSSLFMAGTTFSHTFENAGEYNYFCMVHPWMTGKIQVSYVDMESISNWNGNTNEQNKPKTIDSLTKQNQQSISIWSDKSTYVDGSIIHIEGKTKNIQPNSIVNVMVYSPSHYNIVDERLLVSNNGKFEVDFDTSDKLWFENGEYVIKVEDQRHNEQNQIKVIVDEPHGEFTASAQETTKVPPVNAIQEDDDLSKIIEEVDSLKEHQTNGQPFDGIWEVIDNLQRQMGIILAKIDGQNDVPSGPQGEQGPQGQQGSPGGLVDLSDLQTRIDKLETQVELLQNPTIEVRRIETTHLIPVGPGTTLVQTPECAPDEFVHSFGYSQNIGGQSLGANAQPPDTVILTAIGNKLAVRVGNTLDEPYNLNLDLWCGKIVNSP